MIKGYLFMARINREIAEESVLHDNEALAIYESKKAESGEFDGQKRGYLLR